MLLEALGESLPLAVGLALSPVPIAAVAMVLSARPGNAPAFLAGWLAGIVAVGSLILLIPGLGTGRGDPTALSGWIRLLLGGALLWVAARQWGQRPAPLEPVEMPKVLSGIDSFGAVKTFFLGVALSAFNPKTLVLTFAAVAPIAAYAPGPGPKAVALGLFAIVGSLSVGLPILGYALFPDRSRSRLTEWKDWLIQNNAAVTALLLTVFGTLIGNGLKVLSAS